MKIPVVDHGWAYNGETCPPDQDFIEYLEQREFSDPDITILHMGTGMHHKVGLWAAEQRHFFVRGLTMTPAEVDEYIRLATENPRLNSRYLVDFCDIHLLPEDLLARYDFITLFHLGEISDQANDPEYRGRNVSEVIVSMVKHLSIKGEILFFEKSVAYPSIAHAVDVNMIYRYGFQKSSFKSLTIYKKPRE